MSLRIDGRLQPGFFSGIHTSAVPIVLFENSAATSAHSRQAVWLQRVDGRVLHHTLVVLVGAVDGREETNGFPSESEWQWQWQ